MNATQITMIEGMSLGRSGSLNYKNEIAQTAHELLGVPYQATKLTDVLIALAIAPKGIVVVELKTGEVLFGYVHSEDMVPKKRTLKLVQMMDGIESADYIAKVGA